MITHTQRLLIALKSAEELGASPELEGPHAGLPPDFIC